jgi:hypothetical protein
MARQLDILALEPFYGGARKQMLEALVRTSRHRWTLLKLPPRRIERRITVAANWFAEQLSRTRVGRLDVLFTSEALNLSNFLRLVPALAKFPSVAYFHSNQLPEPTSTARQNEDLANLSTAVAATDVWFNSRYHLRSFLARAAALVERHPELSSRNPMHGITKKVQFLPPPIDTSIVADVRAGMTDSVERNPRLIFIETRDADIRLLNNALGMVDGRGQTFELVTVGPSEGISEDFPRRGLPEANEESHIQAMLGAGIVASAKPSAASDFLVARALIAGCRPVLPRGACYPEMIPSELHGACLFEPPTPDAMATKLINALSAPEPWAQDESVRKALKQFDPVAACKSMDDRLEQLATAAAATHG